MDTSQCSGQLPFEGGKCVLELIPKLLLPLAVSILAQTGIWVTRKTAGCFLPQIFLIPGLECSFKETFR